MNQNIKPIAMRCTEEQFNAIRPKLERAGLEIEDITSFDEYYYLTNNLGYKLGVVSNIDNECCMDYRRTVFEAWNEQTFLEYCGIESKETIKQETMTKYTNYTVPATDVLKIRAIACETWKNRLTQCITRMDEHNMVAFDDAEIDAMFKAALTWQKPTLVEIFGEPTKAVEWNRIKTGSKVMIEYTGQHCGGFEGIDLSQPVDVVFFRTPHFINEDAVFKTNSCHSSYCTFHQNGKYVLFAADKNVDYITEVVEY